METPHINISENPVPGNSSDDISGSPQSISSRNRNPDQGRGLGSPTSESSRKKNSSQTREDQVKEIRGMFSPASPYSSSGSEEERSQISRKSAKEYERITSAATTYFQTTPVSRKRKFDILTGTPATFQIGSTEKSRLPKCISSKADMLTLMGVEDNYRSKELHFREEDDPADIQLAAMSGREVTPKYLRVSAEEFLKDSVDPQPINWLLGIICSYYQVRNVDSARPGIKVKKLCTKLSNSTKINRPDTDVVPPKLPTESSMVFEFHKWQEDFIQHMYKHCFAAWSLWQSEDVKFPVSPTPEEFALYLENRGFITDDIKYDTEFMELREFEWSMDNLDRSSENKQHSLVLTWLDAQLREAAKEVPILYNILKRVPKSDIKGINKEFIKFYKELDNFMKMSPGGAFPLLEVKPGQTLRQFLA